MTGSTYFGVITLPPPLNILLKIGNTFSLWARKGNPLHLLLGNFQDPHSFHPYDVLDGFLGVAFQINRANMQKNHILYKPCAIFVTAFCIFS